MGRKAASLEPASHGGQVATTPDFRKLDAATRYKTIEFSLGGMPEQEVEILRLAHTPIPPAVRPQLAKLGELAHVVMLLAPNTAWVMERIGSKRNAELEELLAKAKRRVTKAISAFRKSFEEWQKLEKAAKRAKRTAAIEAALT
jgi:hypothetical protein